MRILLLSQWFQPEPFFKGLPFAGALRDRGHEVEVLTGFPNYPGGHLYPGYKVKSHQREVMDGIGVIRVPLYPSHGTSVIGRIANYASFALCAATTGTVLTRPADVVYVYHPPGTVGLPAIIHRLLKGIPFVYDIQDLWPDTLSATGMFNNRAAGGLVHRWCDIVHRMAARIVVLSPGFKEVLVGRGVPREKIHVIYNWTHETPLPSESQCATFAEQSGMAGRFNVVFAGTMGKAQALDAVLDAAHRISSKLPLVQFVFVGGGIELQHLRTLAVDKRLGNTLFIPRMSAEEIGKVLGAADVLLVHLRDDPLFQITIPSKTQAYLYAGRPILMAVRGDASRLVTEAGAGLCCEPENPDHIADAVENFYHMPPSQLKQMGENGRRYYLEHLSFQAGVSRFERLFADVVEST